MDDLFASGIWRVDAKYRFESYLAMLPRVISRLDLLCKKNSRRIRMIIATDQEGLEKIKIQNQKKIDLEIIHLELDDLPETPSVSEPCGLKLGWLLSREKMNALNRVWLNKVFLMDELSRTHGDGLNQVTWIDGGLKQFQKNFPEQEFNNFSKAKKRKVYANQYPNADRIKHSKCSLPHHIRAGVLTCRIDFIHEFSRLFSSHMGKVSAMCGSFDEETILSSIYLEDPGLFQKWEEL